MAMSDQLFSDLLLDLGPYLGTDWKVGTPWGPDNDPKTAAAHALMASVLKKHLASDRTSDAQNAVAVEKFHKSNEKCGTWVFNPLTSLDEELLGEFKYTLYKFFYPQGQNLLFHINDLFDRGRCGPGVSVGGRGEDFYTKFFDSPLTCTSEALAVAYSNATSGDGRATWAAAESIRQVLYGDPELVTGSRFSFVPKDDTKSRLIAIEPSLNMFYQLGLGRLLEERLVSFFGLDITSQPQINQEAARFGSATDVLATLDLSDASDSIGLPMLAWALPRPVLDVLRLLRSPYGTLANELLELNMVSTMGNGFTFPLETIIFSSVVVACIKSFRVKPVRPYSSDIQKLSSDELVGYWGVFGDDIICHSRVAYRVTRLLDLLGFSVNRDKSFVEGVFRESCGRDFFKGHDIRGVYIKRLGTPESRYVAINNLNVWSAKVGIYLPNTIKRLVDSVRWLPVPPAENHDAGIRVPFLMVKESASRSRKLGQSIIYRRQVANPKRMTIKEGEIRVPKRTKRRFYNPEGLLLAFLHGSVRDCCISLRQRDVRYHAKRGVTPFWDYIPPTSDIALLADGPRWESAVMVNIS
jgi:hypothetical protein